MDKLDGIRISKLPALIYNLLAAVLDFRVTTLHAGKIEIRITVTVCVISKIKFVKLKI